MKNLLNQLNALEKTDPELLIKLLDDEIAKIEIGRPGMGTQTKLPEEGWRSRPASPGLYNPEVLKKLIKMRDGVKLPFKSKRKSTIKKKEGPNILQRVLDPLGYTRIKPPYEK